MLENIQHMITYMTSHHQIGIHTQSTWNTLAHNFHLSPIPGTFFKMWEEMKHQKISENSKKLDQIKLEYRKKYFCWNPVKSEDPLNYMICHAQQSKSIYNPGVIMSWSLTSN